MAATAFLHFAQAGAKFVVLEVGMGGRLDATNVTDPRVALITNIDFDHMEFLGSTLAAIAAEKAGIIKPHRPVISGVEDAEAAAAIRRRAEECGAELLELKKSGANHQAPQPKRPLLVRSGAGRGAIRGTDLPLAGKVSGEEHRGRGGRSMAAGRRGI